MSETKTKSGAKEIILFIVMVILAILWIYPVFMILMNSLKVEAAITTSSVFNLPTGSDFAGFANYANAINSQGFLTSLGYSTLITVTSVLAIIICCSMCAWYITRVQSKFNNFLYYLFVFSMVVPFQMVMFTLSQTADMLKLNNPFNIWVIYLGFGAGLAVFMFAGFVKSIPVEIEEAAMIDGCTPLQTFFKVVMPILKPTLVSVTILQAMWVWNDYLLPTLVLDITKYKTIPMLIQYFRGSYGKVSMGPMMASIMMTIIPIVIVYILGQKHIIKGVAAGAVKG